MQSENRIRRIPFLILFASLPLLIWAFAVLAEDGGQIDWQKNAQEIERKVRAFYPWPGAWTHFNGQRVKILKAKATETKQEAVLSTGKGFLLLELVQPAGKKPMTGQEFLRGHPNIKVGG